MHINLMNHNLSFEEEEKMGREHTGFVRDVFCFTKHCIFDSFKMRICLTY